MVYAIFVATRGVVSLEEEMKAAKNKVIVISLVAMLTTGCAEAQKACVGGLGAIPGISVLCAANGAAVFGQDIARDAQSGSDLGSIPPLKPFQVAQRLEIDCNNNSEVRAFVMDSQKKYQAGNGGLATGDEKKAAIGRYTSEKLGKTIIIKDVGKVWNVAYAEESGTK